MQESKFFVVTLPKISFSLSVAWQGALRGLSQGYPSDSWVPAFVLVICSRCATQWVRKWKLKKVEPESIHFITSWVSSECPPPRKTWLTHFSGTSRCHHIQRRWWVVASDDSEDGVLARVLMSKKLEDCFAWQNSRGFVVKTIFFYFMELFVKS